MKFKDFLLSKNITSYRLSKETGIPYTTINDLVNEKTCVGNLSLKHAILIADYLKIDVRDLYHLNDIRFLDFRYFRNNTLQDLKREGNEAFIRKIIKEKTIDYYHKNNGNVYALYLLALIDYLCRIDNKEVYKNRYNAIRKETLNDPFFVGSNLVSFKSIEEAEEQLNIKVIPEFKKYNIIEDNVFNIV